MSTRVALQRVPSTFYTLSLSHAVKSPTIPFQHGSDSEVRRHLPRRLQRLHGQAREIKENDRQDMRIRQRRALDVMCEFVMAKIVQRIARNLKTTPTSVILYGHRQTKNIITSREKETATESGETFDHKEDLYRGFYVLLPLTITFDKTLVKKIDEAEAGLGGDGDLLFAFILGLEMLDAQPSIKTYNTKEIYILTDDESETDWGAWCQRILQRRGGEMHRPMRGQPISLELQEQQRRQRQLEKCLPSAGLMGTVQRMYNLRELTLTLPVYPGAYNSFLALFPSCVSLRELSIGVYNRPTASPLPALTRLVSGLVHLRDLVIYWYLPADEDPGDVPLPKDISSLLDSLPLTLLTIALPSFPNPNTLVTKHLVDDFLASHLNAPLHFVSLGMFGRWKLTSRSGSSWVGA
ncbi:hypothetical protein JCM1840_007371 [Sporobolomyces johnsonii]